jgi:hypothetical protein
MEQTQQLERSQPNMLAQVVRAEVDTQVSTAMAYPRDMSRACATIHQIATSSQRVAAMCFYSLQRRGVDGRITSIEGPSVHLARIVVSAWRNFRASSRVLGSDDRLVYAQGLAWDLESNVASQHEVARRITNRTGRRYSEDMIAVTGAAACSIAYRNAVFGVIPRPIWEPIFERCRAMQLEDAQRSISETRNAAVDWFESQGVPEPELLACIGIEHREQLQPDHIVQLRGIRQAYAQGETSDVRSALGLDSEPAANGSWRKRSDAQPAQPAQPAPILNAEAMLESVLPDAPARREPGQEG